MCCLDDDFAVAQESLGCLLGEAVPLRRVAECCECVFGHGVLSDPQVESRLFMCSAPCESFESEPKDMTWEMAPRCVAQLKLVPVEPLKYHGLSLTEPLWG